MYLYNAHVRNYNLPRTGLLQPGYKHLYVFSFHCNPGAMFVEVFARSIGNPEVRIEYADIGDEGFGSVAFQLQEPKQIRIRLDWGIYSIQTCEFALFNIDLV